MTAATRGNSEGARRSGRPTTANAAAAKQRVLFQGTTRSPHVVPDAHADSVQVWLTQVLERLVGPGVDVPLFGSQPWSAAPDPVRLASALRAGEAWRQQGLTIADDLADTHAVGALDRLEDDRGWSKLAAWVSAHRNDPTYAELQQRRGVPVRPQMPPW